MEKEVRRDVTFSMTTRLHGGGLLITTDYDDHDGLYHTCIEGAAAIENMSWETSYVEKAVAIHEKLVGLAQFAAQLEKEMDRKLAEKDEELGTLQFRRK